jgi:hypothetical protein
MGGPYDNGEHHSRDIPYERGDPEIAALADTVGEVRKYPRNEGAESKKAPDHPPG